MTPDSPPLEPVPASVTSSLLLKRLGLLLALSAAAGGGVVLAGLTAQQGISIGVFLAILLGTLFFWSFRLAIAFLGVSLLIFTQSLSIPHFVEAAALPVILFLVGMMILVGALRDLGFFTWVVQTLLSIPHITGRKFIVTTAIVSALLACLVDEVTSILFISALIFQVCNRLKLNPTPYIILCVLCTNIGSAGTMMGNPVGIFIGTHAGLTFGDFLRWAFPIMLVALAATIGLTMFWYRRDLDEFDRRLADRLERKLSLAPVVDVPYRKGLLALGLTIAFIASHHALEGALHLEKNSILLMAPLVCAGVMMLVRHDRARHYVEREVDWWTLMFFMLLFAVAGTLEYSGVTGILADSFRAHAGNHPALLMPLILAVSAVGSAFVDNVIFVAAFAPVIEELAKTIHAMPLWWALLFGACFGGNITLIGSTANIVALGMLERETHKHVRFLDWLKIGALTSLVACFVAWALLAVLARWMPR